MKPSRAVGMLVGVLFASGCQAAGTPVGRDTVRPEAAAKVTAGATLTQEQADAFARNYLRLWQTSDPGVRGTLARKLFAEDAVHYVSPGDASFEGRDKIEANVAKVHDEQIQKMGLLFTVGKAQRNRGALKLNWKISDPAGAVVLSGADIFVLDGNGQVSKLYMFHQP